MSSPWPAALPTDLATALTREAVDWALAHGLVVRLEIDGQPETLPLATHAPLALLPAPFPRQAFHDARRLQPLFNLLVHRISLHDTFLDEVCQSVADVDAFTAALYGIYRQAKQPAQPIVLGIHRSDYLLHAGADAAASPIAQQVELNTIASSFSSLSYLTGELHRHLLASKLLQRRDLVLDLPANSSDRSIADGIAEAWRLFGDRQAVVVMIVQPGERNVFDQRWIEYQLAKLHEVTLVRRTLAHMAEHATKDAGGRLSVDGLPVAVVYYRAGYTPTDYPTDKEWAARLLIETSTAIKCPSIAYHLAGLKKVQQVLALPGQVERFMSPEESRELRSCFTGLFTLSDDDDGRRAVALAMANPDDYVLKPQREGGGNNFYNDQVREMLAKLSPKERSAYILMERIRPPPQPGHVLRRGVLSEYATVSELGFYGIFIGKGEHVLLNREGGHLLRTKGASVDEGGVAAGYAHIDSPLLVA